MENVQLAFDYNACFKSIYYQLYSNSNTSRAERIVSDITRILLFKLAQEEHKVTDLSEITGNLIISTLKNNYPQSCEQFDNFALEDKDIKSVLDSLGNISLLDAPAQIIGDAFQAIIGSNIRGDKGQFFTPKELVSCMVEIMNPQKGNIIIDPACGTGGFLTEAYNFLKAKNSTQEIAINLCGIDKDRDMADLSFATTEIISKGKSNVFNANSLEMIFPDNTLHYLLGTADIVLTNPPFGAKIGVTDQRLLSEYQFGHNWSFSDKDGTWYKLNTLIKSQAPQVLFLELCIKLLKPGGRLAIVLPEGIFGNKSLGYIWAFLKQNGRVIGMIDCPRSTFQPSTDTKTNVLFYEKGAICTEKVLVAIAKQCGHDKRGRVKTSTGRPIKNDFAEIAASYGKTNQSDWWKEATLEGSYFVPRYLSGKVYTKTLKGYISLGQMIDSGYLIRKSGKEVGSEAYGTGDIPFIRTSDIINYEISSDPTNAVSEEIYAQYAKQQNLSVGDILFIADGRYRIGKAAIITKYNIKCLIQSHIEILSLTTDAPFTPYEFLYSLGTDDVQEQIRNMIFIQSTLGTLGNRIKEIMIKLPAETSEWQDTIRSFQNSIETRARCLAQLKQSEHSYEL